MSRNRSFTRSLLALALALVMSPALAVAAETPARVELVVVVHEDGKPVEGLTAADFQVLQPGREARVVGVESVADRQWMLLFDLASPGSDWVAQARAAALELVGQGLTANDRVGVAILGSDSELRVLQPTTDRATLQQAIEAVPDAMGDRAAADADQVATTAEQAVAEAGGLGEGHERGRAHQGQSRVGALAQAVQGLAGLLHAFGGNNHIVVLSSGVDLSPALGNDRTAALDRERAAREAEASATGDLTRRNGIGLAAGGVVEQTLLQATEAASRRGCWVHGVEFTGQVAETARRGGQGPDGLWFLAEETGGEVVRGTTDLVTAFDGLLRMTSAAYRLEVIPAKVRKAGGFHPVKVELANTAFRAEAPGGFFTAGDGS